MIEVMIPTELRGENKSACRCLGAAAEVARKA